jgi:hypothetical protein
MSHRHVLVASLTLCVVLALTGCAEDTYSTRSETPTPAASVTDKATCQDFGDVLTIIQNADVAVIGGRMQAQEQQGWYGLATRVLDRVPTRGEGAVSDAVAALKKVAPAAAQGVDGTQGIDTAEWGRDTQALDSACTAAGSQLAVIGFTGG